MAGTNVAREIVAALFDDLDGRSGFDTGGLDAEVRESWMAEWETIVAAKLQEEALRQDEASEWPPEDGKGP